MSGQNPLKSLFFSLCLLWAAPGLAAGEPDLKASHGDLRVEIYSELSPIPLNRLHSWRIHLLDAEGQALRDLTLALSGGMPDHDHGLPTRPAVTSELSPGVYLLQGMRLHMPGRWLLTLEVEGEELDETVVLEFEL